MIPLLAFGPLSPAPCRICAAQVTTRRYYLSNSGWHLADGLGMFCAIAHTPMGLDSLTRVFCNLQCFGRPTDVGADLVHSQVPRPSLFISLTHFGSPSAICPHRHSYHRALYFSHHDALTRARLSRSSGRSAKHNCRRRRQSSSGKDRWGCLSHKPDGSCQK